MRVWTFLPIVTSSVTNQRGHWSKHSKRTKEQRYVGKCWMNCVKHKIKMPIEVVFTRFAPRMLDPGDNLNSAFKALRDGIAESIGINDRDPAYTWRYEQIKSKEVGVKIEVYFKGEPE